MIVSELKKGPKTFTDLLHATKLPRKTLSLRLKELRKSGIIIKDKEYRLNGSPPPSYSRGEIEKLFTLENKRKILLLALILCISIPVGTYAFATYVAPPPPEAPPEPPQPQYYGILTVDIKVRDVNNLYAWMARINYNASLLEFRNFTKPKVEDLLFKSSLMDEFGLNSTDTFQYTQSGEMISLSNDLLVADSLQEGTSSNGSGTLGRVAFAIKEPGKSLEFFQGDENKPTIVFDPTIVPAIYTYLLNTELQEIPDVKSLLYLEVAEVIS
jgi:DNA-binding transcriptional ArsR family regulator